MDLGVYELDTARDLWRTGRREQLYSASISSISLGAAIEMACWAHESQGLDPLLQQWGSRFYKLRIAVTALTSQDPLPAVGDHAAPSFELRRCPARSELENSEGDGLEWEHFLDRFRRSLFQLLGLPSRKAWAISGALYEMADNVVSHAGLGGAPRGVVAYEVSSEHFGFGVADVGRGVLAALHDNAAHAKLETDQDALTAAVTKRASSRPGPGGKGFPDLLRVLADLEGVLTFRSGTARLGLDGRGRGDRQQVTGNSPEMRGFQLSVHALPRKSSW